MDKKRFVDNNDGTITDNKTSLVWQQEDDGKRRNWDEANEYAKGLELGGYSDWRLPTVAELVSIVDYSQYNPAIDTAFFPDTKFSYYWAGTTNAINTDYAYDVYFSDGYMGSSSKSGNGYVRCVRDGE